MNEPKRVVFLECRHGKESLFTRGLRTGAGAAGWKTEVLFLADAAGRQKSENEVRAEIESRHPSLICFLMDAPLHLERLWESPALARVAKCSFWFDDYYRSPKTLARPKVWTRWQREHNVQVAIWDGFWRKQWQALTGCAAFATHLAADPQLFDPDAAPLKPEWKDRAVFVGTVPSLASLEEATLQLPRFLQQLLADFRAGLEDSTWPLKPYPLADTTLAAMSGKAQIAITAMLKNPSTLALTNHLLWRWGKRVARLRGLAAVAKAGPLAVSSGHGIESYAGEEELHRALPAQADFVYFDSKNLPARSWQNLFRSGKFQVQITDPQSVEGGLPFRVFECAGCGVPLLSDHRKELEELFPRENGVVTATDEASLATEAHQLFGSTGVELAALGRRFHRIFQDGHTWEIRWREAMSHLDSDAGTLDLPLLESAPLDALAVVGA